MAKATASPLGLMQRLTVVAQDPSVRIGGGPRGRILLSALDVPAEVLEPGPVGYRVQVIDYDASTDTLYAPRRYRPGEDPYRDVTDAQILGDPGFHAQNVYAIAMSTLARFEFALGRRVPWGFKGHQLKIAPHAFADANAFYSERDEALLFGYFPDRTGRRTIFSALSHDVVVHETTHAIVDGLRARYTDPSSPDQAAFHEGFADVIALLSVFAQREVVDAVLDMEERTARSYGATTPGPAERYATRREQILGGALRRSALLGLAEQMGQEMQTVRGNALRRSADLDPSPTYLDLPEFLLPHRRGEIFVAAMLKAFLDVWSHRILTRGTLDGWKTRNRAVEAEEGAEVADHLVTIAIRALDYAPAVDLQFGDFLSALLTADRELFKEDAKYGFRVHIPASFRAYGIEPASRASSDGCWEPPPEDRPLRYDRSHFEPLQRDPDEVFRFLWENREALELYPGAYVRVGSVRPVTRQGADGFFLRETVVEYVESLRLRAGELSLVKTHRARGKGGRGASARAKTAAGSALERPAGMDKDTPVSLYGGGVLIFDEFGRVKFHVKSRINSDAQQARLDHLWRAGYFDRKKDAHKPFSEIHLERATPATARREMW